MADPADQEAGGSGSGDGDPVERLLGLIGPRFDDLRSFIDETGSRWRGDATRLGEGTRSKLIELFRELGLVTREEWEELDLRVAQIEHRLRLLEKDDKVPGESRDG